MRWVVKNTRNWYLKNVSKNTIKWWIVHFRYSAMIFKLITWNGCYKFEPAASLSIKLPEKGHALVYYPAMFSSYNLNTRGKFYSKWK